MKPLLIVFIGIVYLSIPSYADEKSVVVIGTIHGDHKRFPLFNFDTLRIALDHINPDLLLIEEDPETLNAKKYLSMSDKEYGAVRPIEIREVVLPFAKKHNIKVVPTDWRTDYDERVKGLDAQFSTSDKTYEAIQHFYLSIFLDDYLTTTIYDLHADKVMAAIEARTLLFHSIPRFKKLCKWDRLRQKWINKNIVHALKHENYKKAVVIYGISHRPMIVRAIQISKVAKVIGLQDAMEPKIMPLFERTSVGGSLYE